MREYQRIEEGPTELSSILEGSGKNSPGRRPSARGKSPTNPLGAVRAALSKPAGRRYTEPTPLRRADSRRDASRIIFQEDFVVDARQYAANLQEVMNGLPFDDIARIAGVLFRAYNEDRAVFVFGNGGCASLASHIACDFGKGLSPLPGSGESGARRLRILSLTDNVPMISAWANDASYEDIFARQMENFIRPGDIAFGLSGSGNSPNILKALHLAREKKVTTVGFSGQGGKMIALLDYAAVVPSQHMQMVEDCHLIMMHMVFLNLRARIGT